VREGTYGLEGGGQDRMLSIINVGGEGNHTFDIYP